MSTKRHCFSCEDDSKLIAEYKAYYTKGKAWPEITKSIKDAGIVNMEIYLVGNRMFMIMEVDETFYPAEKVKMDANNGSRIKLGEKLYLCSKRD